MKLEFRQTVTCNHLTLARVCKTIDWQQPLPRCGEYVAGLDTLDGEPNCRCANCCTGHRTAAALRSCRASTLRS